jgi:hypothetical protein
MPAPDPKPCERCGAPINGEPVMLEEDWKSGELSWYGQLDEFWAGSVHYYCSHACAQAAIFEP